jgi:hypothetical protein
LVRYPIRRARAYNQKKEIILEEDFGILGKSIGIKFENKYSYRALA